MNYIAEFWVDERVTHSFATPWEEGRRMYIDLPVLLAEPEHKDLNPLGELPVGMVTWKLQEQETYEKYGANSRRLVYRKVER